MHNPDYPYSYSCARLVHTKSIIQISELYSKMQIWLTDSVRDNSVDNYQWSKYPYITKLCTYPQVFPDLIPTFISFKYEADLLAFKLVFCINDITMDIR
jgi:hypothetical protein